ncbi:MAG TPA: hypothetical protein VN937_18925 [Blastocatellia bacterium]|nr:hypothetical protein [Blastocatellia bacterium]
MKKLASVCLLTLCLSVPVFAGHIIPGGWCDCGAPGCICDPGETPGGNRATVPDDPKPNDLGAEALLVFAVLLLALRYKA